MSAFKKNVGRIFLWTFWSAVGIGGIVLLVAAMRKKAHQLCKGYEIEIGGGKQEFFVDKKDVELMLFGKQPAVQEKEVSSFDLQMMEDKLEKNVWIRDAQLFFNNDGILKVKVYERLPIARVFNITGSSHYVDSSGKQLPLSDKLSAHLPVFTGFPTDRKKLNREDSLLMRQIVDISTIISRDPFWLSQISQIDISQNRTFEMIPLIGSHVISMGEGIDIDKKLNRLFIFYTKVLSKTGFNYYQKLDLQFDEQVVATKKTIRISKRDSLLAVKKVRQLIAEGQELRPDTMVLRNVRPLENLEMNEQMLKNYDMVISKDSLPSAKSLQPSVVKTQDTLMKNEKQDGKKEINKTEKPKSETKRGFRK